MHVLFLRLCLARFDVSLFGVEVAIPAGLEISHSDRAQAELGHSQLAVIGVLATHPVVRQLNLLAYDHPHG